MRVLAHLVAPALAAAACCGCWNEYHPDYHPVTSYDFRQRVTYPERVLRVPDPPDPAKTEVTATSETHVDPVPPPQQTAAPSPWAGVWYEHVKGTVCDRRVTIDETDDIPYATLADCDGNGTTKLGTTSYAAGGAWRLRRDPQRDQRTAFDVTGSDDLDYRLARTASGELCGTIRVKPWNGKPRTYPVCWSHSARDAGEAPDGVPAWIMGRWSLPRNEIAVENDGGTLRIIRHYVEDSHFETTRARFLDFEGGMVRVEMDADPWRGGVDEVRLRLSDDGSLRGVVFPHPARSGRRRGPAEPYEESWSRPR